MGLSRNYFTAYLMVLLGLPLSFISCQKEQSNSNPVAPVKFFTDLGSFDVKRSLTFENGEMVFVGKSGESAAILVVNEKGEEKWRHLLSGSGREVYYNAIQLPDGGYLVAGSSSSDEFGATGFDNDPLLVRYAPGGVSHTYTCYPTPGSSGAYALTALKQGGYMVVGAYNSGNQRTFVALYDGNLNIQDVYAYYIGDWHSRGLTITELDNGSCAILGYRSLSGFSDETSKYVTFLLSVSSVDGGYQGEVHYDDHYRQSNLNAVLPDQISMSTTSDGICWATTEAELNYKVGIHWVRVDKFGNVLAQKRIYGLGNATVCGLTKLKDGNYLLTGATSDQDFRSALNGYRTSKAMLIKLDADGNEIWKSYLGDNSQIQMAFSGLETGGEIAVGGLVEQSSSGYRHPMFFKTDTQGKLKEK